MKRFFVLLCLFLCLISNIFAQSSFLYYYQRADFLLTSPGAFDDGLLGFANPATLGYVKIPEARLFFAADADAMEENRQWGVFTGANNFGFGWVRQGDVDDYRFSLAGGSESFSLGLGYGWTKSDWEDHKMVSVGSLIRPNRYTSIGLSGIFSTQHKDREGVLDLAVRPLGTDRLTLFGDIAFDAKENLDTAPYSLGAVVKILPGIHLTTRYFDTEAWTAGLSFSLGSAGVYAQRSFAQDNHVDRSYYGIHLGGRKENIGDTYLFKNSKYYSKSLRGEVRYQKFRLFDDESITLSSLLSDLQGVIDDPTVAGVALNLSGMAVNSEMVWEIREKLKEVRSADKNIVVYLDRGGMTEYHLASVADRIILDPEGLLQLEGYLMGRTFQKDLLEKMGLGFDEWRFFKYKSANESLSRDSMSDADREQRQALIDDLYAVVREDICTSRNLTAERFDELINTSVLVNPADAIKHGLADTLGRWVDVEKIIESFEKDKKALISSDKLAINSMSRVEWGARPKIALVYGLGVCDLETGIKARKLEKIFGDLTRDQSVKAVVFRVDSPGGDGLASDLVAEAMKKCSEKKPVIVTQGYVAASGGYWLSMYADTVVSAPHSITGSIGVIGGWVWNKGLGDKLGLKSDHVQVGDHADFAFGIQLPLLGVQIPDRNLTIDERAVIEKMIKDTYGQFVGKVSAGRGISADSIAQIAQGRVWSGLDAKAIGLVDVIGGMEKAIELAKQAANIPADREISIVEFPKPGLFDLSVFMPRLIGYKVSLPENDVEWDYLRKIARHQGQPLPLLPPEYYIR